jgi:TonB family protein
MKNNIFIKSLLISFLIHLFGISFFSIFLPVPPKRNRPIEVLIYNKLETKKKDIEENLIVKKVEENIGKEKVSNINELKSENISTRDIIGEEKKEATSTSLNLDIEKFEFKINFHPLDTIEQNITEEKKSTGGKGTEGPIIEGPVGTRKIIYKEKIEYPLWAQKKGVEGKVKIKFWVNPEGKISDTEIFISSGFPEIDLYAEENFKKWIFEPATTDKDVWGIITFIFKLK